MNVEIGTCPQSIPFDNSKKINMKKSKKCRYRGYQNTTVVVLHRLECAIMTEQDSTVDEVKCKENGVHEIEK